MRFFSITILWTIVSVSVFAGTNFSNQKSENLGQLVVEYAVKGHKKIWQIDQFGNKTAYKYNSMGQLVMSRVDGRANMEYRYYKNGRLGATRDKLGRVTKKKYDINGRITKQIDALGLVSKFNYDKFGRLIARKGAGAYPLQYQYTSFSEVSSYTDKNGSTTKFEYDDAGRITKRIWANGSEISYSYNKQGKLAVKKEAGRVTKYKYDDMMRLVQVKILQGKESLITNMMYNEAGRMTSISDGSTTVRFSYDRFGRKLLEEGPVGTFKYMYNERGLLSMRQCEFKGRKDKFITSYTYDNYNRVTKVESPAGTYKYKWGRFNKIKAIEFGNDQKIVYKYDKAKRLIRKKMGDTVLTSYKYDNLNRRVAASYMGIKWKYDYDKYNQLVKAESSLKQKYNYEYDVIGNRTSVYNSLIASTKNFDYNDLNQIVLSGYAYDNWGNMIRSPGMKYKYDLKNRLVEYKKGNLTISYTYDALDQRISAVQNDKQTDYLMSGMVEYARESDRQAQYHTLGLDLYGTLNHTGAVGAVLASSNAVGLGFNYLYDGNGNVIASCNNSGKVLQKLSYSPFGKQVGGEKLPFTFSTKVTDSSDIYYYGLRWYNITLNRWLSNDPIELENQLVFQFNIGVSNNYSSIAKIFSSRKSKIRNVDKILPNLYLFANNSPVSYIDKYGLASAPSTMDDCWVTPGDYYCGSFSGFAKKVCEKCLAIAMSKPAAKQAKCRTCQQNCTNRCGLYFMSQLSACTAKCSAKYAKCIL